VLAGQSRDWILPFNANYPIPPVGDTIRLLAQTDDVDIEAKILITQ